MSATKRRYSVGAHDPARPGFGVAGFEPLEPRVYLSADFNGDGRDDTFWRNQETGQNGVWFMEGPTRVGSARLQSLDTDWVLGEVADFTGDGKADVLWRAREPGGRPFRDLLLWVMDGTSRTESRYLQGTTDRDWHLRGAADFDGDRTLDLVWQHGVSGRRAISYMRNDGTMGQRRRYNSPGDQDWVIGGVGDFDGDLTPDTLWRQRDTGEVCLWLNRIGPNPPIDLPYLEGRHLTIHAVRDLDGDGDPDVVWRDDASGVTFAWIMDGTSRQESRYVSAFGDPDWRVRDVSPRIDIADFNGDGQADLVWRNSQTGENVVWIHRTELERVRGFALQAIPDLNWELAWAGDFDSDGEADLLWRNRATTEVALWLLDKTSIRLSRTLPAVGSMCDLEWAGDLDGDRDLDLLWNDSVTGENHLWLMRHGVVEQQLAMPETIPAAWNVRAQIDFDGDGGRDLLWHNADTRESAAWIMDGTLVSQSVALPAGPGGSVFSGAGDVDGDGGADILWYDPSTGANEIWRFSAATRVEIVGLPAFRTNSWAGTLRDVDGDGRFEILWHSDYRANHVWRLTGTAYDSVYILPAWHFHPEWRLVSR